MAGRYGKYGEIKRFDRLRKSKTEKLKIGLSLLGRKHIEDHNIFKKDCPKCEGYGTYTMTNCEDEAPIQCCCDDYNGEEWEDLKEKWVLEGWAR
jgi:hypothetical protein